MYSLEGCSKDVGRQNKEYFLLRNKDHLLHRKVSIHHLLKVWKMNKDPRNFIEVVLTSWAYEFYFGCIFIVCKFMGVKM